MEFKGVRQCPICEDRCYESQVKEVVRSRVPKKRTIHVCLECYGDWRTDPEHEHLRPDYTVREAEEIKQERDFYAEDWVPY